MTAGRAGADESNAAQRALSSDRPSTHGPALQDWNVIVTVRDGGYTVAREHLQQLGAVSATAYYNVLAMRVDDPRRLLDRLRSLCMQVPELGRSISRLVPVTVNFLFQSSEEFEARTKSAVSPWLARLAGKSFHVRMHRRGFKGRLSSQAEEQSLGRFILESLQRNGACASLSFTDPDVIVAVETLGQRAGLSLWSRADCARYPWLKLD